MLGQITRDFSKEKPVDLVLQEGACVRVPVFVLEKRLHWQLVKDSYRCDRVRLRAILIKLKESVVDATCVQLEVEKIFT